MWQRRGKLRIRFRFREAQPEQRRRNGRNAVKQPRIRERLNRLQVGAAKCRDVARQSKAEMIVKDTKATRTIVFGFTDHEKPARGEKLVLILKAES